MKNAQTIREQTIRASGPVVPVAPVVLFVPFASFASFALLRFSAHHIGAAPAEPPDWLRAARGF
jgi:hypothetical protein